MILNNTCTLCSAVNWMRARYLMLQGQMDYAMMYLDRVSTCQTTGKQPLPNTDRPHANLRI